MAKAVQNERSERRFEEALVELETIVEELETGTSSLEEALKKYEKGVALSRFCVKKLDDIQKRIQVLKDDGSKIEFVDLEEYTSLE